MRNVILGAGIAGIGAAYELNESLKIRFFSQRIN